MSAGIYSSGDAPTQPPRWASGGFHRRGSQVVAMRSHLNKHSSPSVWTAGDPAGSEEDHGPHPPPPSPPPFWGWHSAGICPRSTIQTLCWIRPTCSLPRAKKDVRLMKTKLLLAFNSSPLLIVPSFTLFLSPNLSLFLPLALLHTMAVACQHSITSCLNACSPQFDCLSTCPSLCPTIWQLISMKIYWEWSHRPL